MISRRNQLFNRSEARQLRCEKEPVVFNRRIFAATRAPRRSIVDRQVISSYTAILHFDPLLCT